MCAMQSEVFGDRDAEDHANAALRRLASGDGMQLWVAEADGQIVSAGGSSRSPGPSSPGSGAGPRGRNGGAGGSTGP